MFSRTLAVAITSVALVSACKEGAKTSAPAKAAPAKKAPEPTPPAKAPELAKAAEPGATGTITGVVKFAGEVPPESKIQMRADPKCAKLSPDAMTRDHVVTDGKVANTFVYVKSGLAKAKYPAPDVMPVLDQKGCQYQPKMLGVLEGQSIEIVNSDPTLHNIHGFGKQEFNIGMPRQDGRIERKFKKAEVLVQVKCDVHPWMEAHIGVVEHPFFAVSGADGTFEIKDVPVGRYTLEAVHPRLGSKTFELAVASGGEAHTSIELEGK